MKIYKDQQAFFEILRAGLWEKDARLSMLGSINLNEICRIAEEQAVVGLVAAGLEHVVDVKLPKEDVLPLVGQTLQLEQRNKAMNSFVAKLINQLRGQDVYALLVKGQGIAQCYERPLWRSSGDVDLLLSNNNYKKANTILSAIASSIDDENHYNKHIAMTIDGWSVELHGSLRGGLWKRIDRELDKVQNFVFYEGNVRSWMNCNTQVFLPAPNEDVVFVFSHILQHFYKEGIGLRQICDWCRLLWTCKDSLDLRLLESRIRKMGVRTEWKTFAALSVDYLGMPTEAMPFYSPEDRWSRKADKVMQFVFETGNFGHNRDYSYYNRYPYVVYKLISFFRHTHDILRYMLIFPKDAFFVFVGVIIDGVRVMKNGK